MRACENCEWGKTEIDHPRGPSRLVCRESAVPVSVDPNHWCGRFRIAERLTGGRDVRGVAS